MSETTSNLSPEEEQESVEESGAETENALDVSELDFQKALEQIDLDIVAASVSENNELVKSMEVDATGFLRELGGTIDAGSQRLVKALNLRLGAQGTLLKKALAELSAQRELLDRIAAQPASAPKGARTAKALEKSFGDAAGAADAGPDSLTIEQLHSGLDMLMQKAMSNNDLDSVDRYGRAGGMREASGMIHPQMRSEVYGQLHKG